ncbi:MAG TPA: hypothetical protein VGG04_01860 [Candidatus Sulfotelmatobacter sp.]
MPDIKYDSMTLRNGPVVQGIGPDDIEKSIASAARIRDSFQQEMSADICLRHGHTNPP